MFTQLFFLIYLIGFVKAETDFSIFPQLPVVLRKSENVVCRQQNEEYLDNLKNFSLWAYEMRDSSASSTVAVLRGSIFNMGDFSQCLTSGAPFPTQFCLAQVTANIPPPKSNRNPFSLEFDPNESIINKMYVAKYPEEGNGFILCMFFSFCYSILIAILIILVLSSTSWEYYKEYDKTHKSSFLFRAFLAFSAKKNFPHLNKAEGSNHALTVLYGIKTFSICMIILDHRFGTFVGGPVSNFDYIEQNYRNTLVTYIFHGDLFVDTFFVISGLLVVYNLMSTFEKKFINPGFIIFMRYLRLTPVYAFVLFYACTIFYHSGSGPLWNAIVGREVQDCRKNFWASLLYISNYFDTEHMCLPHTWYLPCDFHYFIVAVGLVLLISKQRKCGLTLLVMTTCISILIPFVLILVYESQAFLRFFPDFLQDPKGHVEYQLLYIKSHTRAAPYFVGMVAGYIYYKLKGSGKILSMCYTTILAAISFFLLLVCMFSGIVFYDPHHEYNSLESASYGALHRTIWALGSFGIMYTASFGTYTILYKFLSWNPWIPLSKLVFGAYLWHFVFQLRALGKAQNTRVFNFFDLFSSGLGDIFLGFMLALGSYLTVEAPSRRILKEIFSPHKLNITDTKIEELPNIKEISRV